jgi:hypothetical protein
VWGGHSCPPLLTFLGSDLRLSAFLECPSREVAKAAKECSPQRKLWVGPPEWNESRRGERR